MSDIKIMFCDYCRIAVSVTDPEKFQREHNHEDDGDE